MRKYNKIRKICAVIMSAIMAAFFLTGCGTDNSGAGNGSGAQEGNLNSRLSGHSSACPPSQTTTMRSAMAGSSSSALATLVLAPMVTTYSGFSGE